MKKVLHKFMVSKPVPTVNFDKFQKISTVNQMPSILAFDQSETEITTAERLFDSWVDEIRRFEYQQILFADAYHHAMRNRCAWED